jgi:hypothetical protein
MNRRLCSTGFHAAFVALACWLSEATALAQPAAAPAPDAPATLAGHNDDQGFVIPTLPDPSNGFGKLLADACGVLKGGKSIKAPAEAAPATVVSNQREAARQAALNASNLYRALVSLGPICDAIDAHALTDAQLETLRGFDEAGEFPGIAQAVVAQNAAAQIDVAAALQALGKAPDQVQGPLATPSMAGFESNLINGLSDFLVTRSKEEAMLYLQDEIADTFCKDDALKVIPRTCAAIQGLDSSLSIAAIGTTLNAAARRDLTLFPDGLLKVLSSRDNAHFGIYEGLRLLYALVLNVQGGRIPLEVVRSVHAMPARACESTAAPVPADVSCQQLFLSYRAASALVYSAQASAVDQLARSLRQHPAIVVGTLVETERRANAELTQTKLVFKANHLTGLTQVLAQVGEVLSTWKRDQAALTSADSKSTPTDRRRLLGNVVFDSVRRVGRIATELAPHALTGGAKLENISLASPLVQDAATLGRDAVNEDYGAIPLDLDTLLADLGALKLPVELAGVVKAARRFVPVVTEIAAAKSSADVAAALEAAAAPASSFRAKYQRTKLSLAAFVGGLVGRELPNDPNNPALGRSRSSGMVAGFAPVGAELSFPLCSWAYGAVMLSIIDIGALTTARFEHAVSSDPAVSTNADVTFAQVFSPGAYGAIGLGKSPFVLGGGVSYAPGLRSLELNDAAGVTLREKISALRYGGFLAVDVSMFSL